MNAEVERAAALLQRCEEAKVAFLTLNVALLDASRCGQDTPAQHKEWREALDALAVIRKEMEAEVAAHV